MKRARIGGLDVVLAGGTDGDGGGPGPAVVLLHGYGAPGEDLVSLWRVFQAPRDTRWVFPAAPLSLASIGYGDGRAWWHLDMQQLQEATMRGDIRALSERVPEGLVEARARVNALLDELESAHGAPGSRTVLGGFSQGSMLSLDVALHRAAPLAGLVLLSSTLIAADEWQPRFASRKGLRVLQSHGRRDPILPFAFAEMLRDKLVAAGLGVTWVPFGGGHEIPGPVVDAAGKFLGEVLAPA